MTVYTAKELKTALGARYVLNIATEAGDVTSRTVRYVLRGECEDLSVIRKVMNAAEAAINERNTLKEVNAKLRGTTTPTQHVA